jgi:hypothetical protein
MKTRLGLCLALALTVAPFLPAQEPPPVTVTNQAPVLTSEELEKLVGPIALYPDALIALILPAAAAPVDLVLAARYLNDGGNPEAASSRAWDESVKSLAHYPDVVKWMDENIEWTKQLGEAFLTQPADVMNAIQRLRAVARAAGTLADTPQQLVGLENNFITIVPAQPDVIYVPRYSPEIVYVQQPYYYSQPFLTFSTGFAVGAWLTNDCDWHSRRIWTVNRQWSWREHRDWRRPTFPGYASYVPSPHRQPWSPPPNVARPPATWRGRDYSRPIPVQTVVSQPQIERPISPTTPPPRRERERENTPRRPAPTAASTQAAAIVGPQPMQPSPTVAPTISMPGRPAVAAPERRARQNPTVAGANRPAPNQISMPQPAYANTAPQTQERSFPFNTAPSTPVVAPIMGPLVAPMAQPPAPARQISFPAPAATNSAPAPAARPASSPAPSRRTPPPASAPAPRDDKKPERREVEP